MAPLLLLLLLLLLLVLVVLVLVLVQAGDAGDVGALSVIGITQLGLTTVSGDTRGKEAALTTTLVTCLSFFALDMVELELEGAEVCTDAGPVCTTSLPGEARVSFRMHSMRGSEPDSSCRLSLE